MDDIKIREILERHQHWLKRDCDKWEEMRADLRGADLCGAYLREANLCEAKLSKANLCKAYLCGADLRGADLYGADLCEADLSGANLREVNLCEADLSGADLSGTNLCEANNVPFIPYACPDFGVFTGFKKAHDLIVMLEIPEDAQRISATGRKCRCNKAKVLEIQNIDGTKASVTSVSSDRDINFVYEVGKEVYVPDFDNDRWKECSTGIHFFINRQEAVNYTW